MLPIDAIQGSLQESLPAPKHRAPPAPPTDNGRVQHPISLAPLSHTDKLGMRSQETGSLHLGARSPVLPAAKGGGTAAGAAEQELHRLTGGEVQGRPLLVVQSVDGSSVMHKRLQYATRNMGFKCTSFVAA